MNNQAGTSLILNERVVEQQQLCRIKRTRGFDNPLVSDIYNLDNLLQGVKSG